MVRGDFAALSVDGKIILKYIVDKYGTRT